MRLLLCAACVLASGLVVGVVAPRGDASASTTGDGCLVVSGGYGKVTLNLARGVVFGRFQSGFILANDVSIDPKVPARLPTVPGVPPIRVNEHLWKYGTADSVRFRASAPLRLTVNATYINLSVAGKGSATLSVNNFLPDIAGNLFSVDAASFCEDNFQQMPLTATKVLITSPIAG